MTALKLCRPWKRNRDDSSAELLVLAKRNYKVHAYIGPKDLPMMRHVAVLDTGAGHNFIRLDQLPPAARRMIRQRALPDIRDANKGRVRSLGVVSLRVQVGLYQSRVDFVVCERLSVPVILGCDYCDRHIEAIRPRSKEIELDDGTTVPIVRAPTKRSRDSVPLPKAFEFPTQTERPSVKVKLTEPYRLQPGTQTWVKVTAPFHGTGILQSRGLLYERFGVAPTNGVVHVEPGKVFRILLSNFSNRVRLVQRNQIVGELLDHPHAMASSNLRVGDLLGISEEIDSEEEHTQPTPHEEKEEITSARDLDLSHIPDAYREPFREMLGEFEEMYSGKLGAINTTEHAIELVPGTRPVHTQPYREGPKTREIVKGEVERQLRAGVIEPAQSAWASPVVIVPKPDGTPRFCVDYRRLNAVTVRDSYPLPRMDDCIDSLGNAVVFTTLDANCGYWQLPIRKEDQELTTFVCHKGTYKYVRMPFGLSNAPATFQRVLDIILARYRWQTCLVYLDDVIVFSSREEDHVEHVREVLNALHEAGVTLKLRKCEFFKKSVRYLGHVISPGKLEIDKARTKALLEATHPTNQSELRSFLGCCNVYRRFIRDYTKIAAPLYAKLKKGQPIKLEPFDDESCKAFETLISSLTSPPVLALPRADLPYSIDTDASEYQVGVALFQHLPNGDRQPIGFWSRTLQAAEKNYSTPEKECLAVVWACGVLRPYLQGDRFLIHTDQASLRWLLTTTDGTGRLMRWRLRLSEFDFDVKYKKGSKNSVADCLSRLRTLGETTTEVDDQIPCFNLDEEHEIDEPPQEFDDWEDFDLLLATEEEEEHPVPSAISTEELIREQGRDPFCKKIRISLDRGRPVPFVEDESGVLFRTQEGHPQLVIPRSLVPRVLWLSHYPKAAGHPGETKLYRTLRRHFYWTTLSVDAVNTVRNCVSCARNRVKLRRNSKKLQLFPASGPLEYVSIDILGPLLRTSRRNRYILVISDRYTKLTRAIPVASITAQSVAREFAENWAFIYGPPTILLSDNGKQFASKLFVHICKLLGTKNAFTSTYHPQANGQVERFNRTLIAALRHYVLDHPKDWDQFVGALTYAYNTQFHRVTGFSPMELVLSRAPLPLSFKARPDLSAMANRASAHKRWSFRLRKLLATAAKSQEQAQARYKRDFDRRLRRNAEELVPGMYVFVRREYYPRSDGSTPKRHKLSPVADGAFKVLSVDESTIVIDDGEGNEERLSRDRVVRAPISDRNAALLQPRATLEVATQEVTAPPSGVILPPTAPAAPTSGTGNFLPATQVLEHIEKELSLTPGSLEQVLSTPQEDNSQLYDDSVPTPPQPQVTSEREVTADPHPTGLQELLAPPDSNADFHPEEDESSPPVGLAELAAESQTLAEDPQQQSLATPTSPRMESEAESNESRLYVVDKILDHATIDGKLKFHVLWYDTERNRETTWEPLENLRRSHVTGYCRRVRLPFPPGLNRCMEG